MTMPDFLYPLHSLTIPFLRVPVSNFSVLNKAGGFLRGEEIQY
jgi:hypothetical protein